jgi:hypothetical protein
VIAAADWVTISALATAGGTLVLALATFASVRSANRAARLTERSLLAGLRPVLMPSRPEDAPQKVGFVDGRWFRVPGSGAVAEATDEAVYFVDRGDLMPLITKLGVRSPPHANARSALVLLVRCG